MAFANVAMPAVAQTQEAPIAKPGVVAPAPPAPALHEVTDEMGRRVRLPVEIRRIVSLAPSLTETVFALGAGDRLVGVTDYCDYPAEALTRTKVGGPINPSLEQIAALHPDVVLAQANGGNRLETVEALEHLGIPVYATGARTVDEILESTRTLAALIGAGEKGSGVVADLRARLDHLKERLAGRKPRRVFFVVWHEPLITIGKHTFLADALRYAGGEVAIELEQDWPRLSLEEVVRVQPEVIVFASAHAEAVQQTVAELRESRGWRQLSAVQQQRIAVISDAVNRPGPRLVDAIEELARQLHPEAFVEKSAPPKPENGKGKMEKSPGGASLAPFPFSLFPFPNDAVDIATPRGGLR